MKLSEAIKEKGSPFNIPDCSRAKLPEFFREMGFKTGAEIGVFHGEFTEKLCQAGLFVYGIDPWMGYVGAGRSELVQDKQDVNFNQAKKNLSPYKNLTLIRKTSIEALKDFKDQSLDFVYIDGDHRFRYIAEDISEWYQKVRPGGIVSGHDYFLTQPKASNVICQVQKVVDAFVYTYGIESFYVLGDNSEDRTPSWMFFKPS